MRSDKENKLTFLSTLSVTEGNHLNTAYKGLEIQHSLFAKGYYIIRVEYCQLQTELFFSNQVQGGETMSIIEQIIRYERADADEFMRLQRQRLIQLKAIQKRKSEGKTIRRQIILKELQQAGILDENGVLAEPYRKEEQCSFGNISKSHEYIFV